MAIYHCSVRVFSRALGHSAVAAAAYRAGAVIHDERRGYTHRYHQRTGVVDSFILTPAQSPEHLTTRSTLWNAAELAETRKNARVAREVILALPYELDLSARQQLARDMASYLVERYRVAVDVALHSPYGKDGHDPRNHHAHLLFTTREVTKDGLGKKTRILDDKEQGPQEIETIRVVWETLANAALEQAGLEARIDRRTLEDQGIDRIPQIHIGPEGRASHGDERRDEDDEDDSGTSAGSNSSSGGSSQGPKPVLTEEEDDSDETRDDDTGEDGKSGEGKQGSGDARSLTPTASKEIEESKTREPDYRVIESRLREPALSRAELVEEIRNINKAREFYPPEPLPVQIRTLEHEIVRLDRQVQRFEKLLSQTSLPQAILHLIKEAIAFSKSLFIERGQHHTQRQFSQTERETRNERQFARYGLTYRRGIHEQMHEMKDNLRRIEATTQHLKHYKQLVERIESALRENPAILFKNSAQRPISITRTLTTPESNIKLKLRADFLKEHIPAIYRPDHLKSGALAQTFKGANKSAEAIQTIKQQKTLVPFREAAIAGTPHTTTIAPPWKIRANLNISGITEAAHKRYEAKAQRQAWFIPAAERMRPLQQSIDIKLAETKPPITVRPERDTAFSSALFNAHSTHAPVIRTAINYEVIEKLKAEAQTLRQTLSKKHRLEPYPEQEQATAPIDSAKADAAEPTAKTHSRPTMAAAFNQAASHNTQGPEKDHSPGHPGYHIDENL